VSEITLPKKIIKATRKSPGKLVIYSSPKTGKTTQLAALENNLILDLEKGTHFVDALKIEVNSLKELYEVGNTIKKEGKPYKYISLDTATKLEEWCEEYATNLYKQTPIGKNFKGKSVLELPNGGGYHYLRQAFVFWLHFVTELADNVIFVCHLKDKFISNKRGEEVAAKDLDLTGKIRNIIAAGADAIGYMYRGENSNLRISFTTSDEVVCGSRTKHLAGQDFEFSWDKIYID